MNSPVRLISTITLTVILAACAVLPKPQEAPETAVDSQAGAQQAVQAREAPDSEADREELFYQLLVAEIAGHRGALDVSVNNYLAVARRTRDPEIAERATRIAVYAHKNPQALEAAELWAKYAPNDIEAHQIAAVLYIKTGQAEGALKHLERVLEASGEDPSEGFLFIATLLSREKDSQAALAVMGKLVEKHRDDPNALYAYANLAMRADEHKLAMRSIDRALRSRPDWPEAIILRAQILRNQGQSEVALGYLQKVLDQRPDDQQIRLAYARLLVTEEQIDAAYRQFELLHQDLGDDADVLLPLGLLALESGRNEEAQQYLLQLIKMGKRLEIARFYLGQAAEAKGDLEEAIRWYSAVESGPNYLDAQMRVAVLMAEQGNIAEARSYLHAISTTQRKHRVQLYLVEGEILRKAGQLEAAFEVYNNALAELPEDAELLYARALLAESLDRLDVLEEDLTKILQKNPENASALNALGYTLADRTERYEEALTYVSRALELEPDDAAILDSMGWVRYRLGEHDEALKYLRRALELSNGDAEVAAHLGEVLWVVGDKEGAREVWNRALQQAPDNVYLLRVIKRFE